MLSSFLDSLIKDKKRICNFFRILDDWVSAIKIKTKIEESSWMRIDEFRKARDE